jgi:hypothetical protein
MQYSCLQQIHSVKDSRQQKERQQQQEQHNDMSQEVLHTSAVFAPMRRDMLTAADTNSRHQQLHDVSQVCHTRASERDRGSSSSSIHHIYIWSHVAPTTTSEHK